ncbi:MAG: DUF6429 family protein [Rhodanobacteraceae bacterium]
MNENLDNDRVDYIILALLWANSFKEPGGHRAWKSLDWDALDRLHERGLIGNPRSRAHSVTLSDEAFQHGGELFQQWFGGAAVAETPAVKAAKTRARKSAARSPTVHQFKITLDDTKPPIWRRIQLPSDATFWDLHCAINDAMGWEDMHLHSFHIGNRRSGVEIGIPMDDMPLGDTPVLADWDIPIAEHFGRPKARGSYLYDFGDGWSHQVVLEAIIPREANATYPRCIDGARACPPEDCGGAWRFAHLCELLANPNNADEEGEELLEWVGDDFDPNYFDPADVRFHSAKRRLKALRDAG